MIPYEVSIKYMVAGYAVIFAVLVIYLISIALRFRRLRKEMQFYKDLEKE